MIFFLDHPILNNIPDTSVLALFAFFISLGMAILIVLFHRHFLNLDNSMSDIQVAHLVPTPRYGGLAVFFAIAAPAFFFQLSDAQWIVISSLPIFVIGLAEDSYLKTAPTLRYFLGTISAVCGVLLSGVALNSIDLGYIDRLLSVPFAAFIFTVFCIVGLINAVNLIDGIHGLSSGVTVIMSLSFFAVAQRVGDAELANLGIILAAASLGLMILNYPFGKIFMGDLGAYLYGFYIALITIILFGRNPELPSWGAVLVLFYPLMEIFFSYYRKIFFEKISPIYPDSFHLHLKIYRLLSLGIKRKKVANGLVMPTLAILWLSPCALIVLFYNSLPGIILSLVLLVIAYLSFYCALPRK